MIPINTDELERLIRRTGEGDMDALETLYKELKDSIFGLALMYTKSFGDAEDIVHDTFLAVWKSSSEFKRGAPKAWIMKIARNISLNFIKKQSRSRELDENFASEDFCGKSEDSVMLMNLLKHLKESEREIVMLHAHGYSHEEIAKITGIPGATVRWKYSNAIKKLSEISGGEK